MLNESHRVRQTAPCCAGTAGGPSGAPGMTAPAHTSLQRETSEQVPAAWDLQPIQSERVS